MKEKVKSSKNLSKNQLLVMDSLKQAKQPLGAYSLLDKLREKGLKAPLQVYRTLDQLEKIGLIHRIETLNAWTLCCEEKHECTPIFAICDDCGTVTEHLDKTLFDNIVALPVSGGFMPNRTVVEIHGKCENCGTT
ncbi:MAG: FUR family transcriptional regulator [SAR324 cluster bacterium]|uniref:FUR family transcriptional regulator n=1 Tax=SAR324 cluster bacterium TaxID=2024889 RepID=A0A2D6YLT2_9DELT|nr:FUR family transcriptional regulator [SAR324 cluster bacterium]